MDAIKYQGSDKWKIKMTELINQLIEENEALKKEVEDLKEQK